MIKTMFGLFLGTCSASLFLQEKRSIKRRKKIEGIIVFMVIFFGPPKVLKIYKIIVPLLTRGSMGYIFPMIE